MLIAICENCLEGKEYCQMEIESKLMIVLADDREGLRPVGALVIWVVSSNADYAYCLLNFFVVVSILMKRLFLFVLVLSMGCTHYFVGIVPNTISQKRIWIF